MLSNARVPLINCQRELASAKRKIREYRDERGGLYHTVRGTTRRSDSCGRIYMNMKIYHRERLGLEGFASPDSWVSYFGDAIKIAE